jgi:hypothetical protein
MRIQEAFNDTLEKYRIGPKMLAEVAGVSDSSVYNFRQGKRGASDEMLDRFLDAMDKIEPGARHHFCSLLADTSPERTGVPLISVDDIRDEDIPRLLISIARKWGKSLEMIG